MRRGGITGEGECGAIKAGELVLGQYLGDPDPTAPVTPKLREAVFYHREQWQKRLAFGPGGQRRSDGTLDSICNHLTAPQGEFMGEKRHQFCTNLAATVAETLARAGVKVEVRG